MGSCCGASSPSGISALVSNPLLAFVRDGFASAAPYNATHHDFAWQHRELDRLMSNECPIAPSPAVIRAAMDAMAVSNLYPYSGEDLRTALAAFAEVAPESVVLGNGSTEVLDVVTRILVGPGDEAIIATPTYAFFETQTRLNGGQPVFVPLSEAWRLDVPAILRSITSRTKAIFLCSPNNPTGNSWDQRDLRSVLSAGIPTIVDQAYLECGNAESFAPLVASNPHLVVTRTMSKGFGLAGLRIGYAIANPWLADVMLRVRIPFSISLIAIWAGLAAVQDLSELERRRRHTSEERERLFVAMEAMPGVRVYPSEANFLLADISATGRSAADIVRAVRDQGILIRAMTAHRLEGSHVRVTIGTSEQNDHFLAGFPRALETDVAAEAMPG
jgi:histidinol-phosphate aminotransferase